MRRALAGLTTRGRSFVAAGVASTMCALGLGERDLLRVGVFLLALPAVALAVVYRTRYRLACTRRLDPPRVPAGQAASVVLRLENVSRLPTGVLLVEDTLPYVLGGRPRFVLDRVESQGVREVSYPVRSDLRGRYRIGPLSVRLADPFGLCELNRSFAAVDSLVVTPQITSLPPVRLRGEWAGAGESRARSVSSAGEDDVATREYRQGDDLRRVHWRSTARYGELMVRREEQPWQSRAAVLLDTREDAHRGDGPGSSFEWSVSAAASVGVHLSRSGYLIRLVTGDGDVTGDAPGLGSGTAESLLLDALAVVAPSGRPSLGTALTGARRASGDGLLVVVLGRLDPDEAELLSRLRRTATAGVAILLDTSTWATLGARARAEAATAFTARARLLRAAGWRVLPVRHGTSLGAVWPQAGTSAARRTFEGSDPVVASGGEPR
jgi:uncharacterized protein (DUF58 family)